MDIHYARQRLEAIEAEMSEPRCSASMDCRHDDWGDGNGSYWGRLKAERNRLINIVSPPAPAGDYTNVVKSPMMVAQQLAALRCMQDKAIKDKE